MNKLDKKIAVITGGARGIGYAIAERFLIEGAQIALCDVNADGVSASAAELAGKYGATVRPYAMNVADADNVQAAVSSIIADFGRIDILINNAGITRDTLMIRMKQPEWDSVIAVNLTGTFNVTRSVAKEMMKARYGRIVNMASVVGLVGNVGQINYAASKAGVIGITKTTAKEFALRGITANAIAPGFIQTDMTEQMTEDAKDMFLTRIPLNRPGTVDDVASAAVFLASDDAAYITGQVLTVDGGMVM